MINRILKILLVINLLVLDVGLVYEIFKPVVLSDKLVTSVQSDTCGVDCKAYISQQLAARITPAAVAGPSATPKAQVQLPPIQKKIAQVQYVTIPGSGNVGMNNWTDVSGTDFYFNIGDYPGLVSVYYEANLSLYNGNGMASVRLLDVTHGIGVQGSEVQTSNQVNTVVSSGQVNFWAGKNLIRVQAKSLTADTAVYTSGRLRITSIN